MLRFMTLLMVAMIITTGSVYAQSDPISDHKAILTAIYSQPIDSDVSSYYAPDYVLYGIDGEMTLDEVTAANAALLAAMPDLTITVEVLIAEGEWAASRLRYAGTLTEDWIENGGVVGATGQSLAWTVNNLVRFDDQGLIMEEYTAYDRLVLPLVDGILPPYLVDLLVQSDLVPPVIVQESPVSSGREAVHKTAFEGVIEGALNNGDLNAIQTYMVEDYHTYEPFGSFSRDEFSQVVEGFRAAVPDLHVDIEAMVAEGDWLAARLIYTGTFSQAVSSGGITLEPTNEPIRFIINVLVRFNAEGVGIEDYKEYNRLGWLTQLGLTNN